MLLAIDIGNTNVTIGLFKAGALATSRRAATQPRATVDGPGLPVGRLVRLGGGAVAGGAAIASASVVPSLGAAIEAIAERRERSIVVASSGTVPLAVRIDRPNEVGADRL